MFSVDEKSLSVHQKLKHNLFVMQAVLFSNLLNQHPYCLEKGSYKLFQQAQKKQIDHDVLRVHLILLLNNCLKKIKNKALVLIFKQLQESVLENARLFLRLDEIHKHPFKAVDAYKVVYEDYKRLNTLQEKQLKQLRCNLDVTLQDKIGRLKKNLGASFPETMRLQSTVLLYEQWNQYLLRFQEELPEEALTREANRRTKMLLLRCVTYTKKDFFKNFLSPKQEKMREIMLSVDMEVHAFSLDDKHVFSLENVLLSRSELLEKEIEKREKLLQKNISFCEKVSIRLMLAVMQQPDFQFGDRGFDAVIRQMDKFETVPYLGDKLHPVLKERAQKTVGFLCLMSGLWGASLLGYGQHLVSAFNRIIDADITLQLKIGKSLDAWTKRYFFRSDPIGIIEKESILQWIMGLGLSLGIATASELFSTESVLPLTLIAVTVAYTSATLSGRAANDLLDYLGKKVHLEPETLTPVKLIVHVIVYSTVQQKMWNVTYFSLVKFNERMKARDILGCGFMDSQKIINKRFRMLSFDNHPDRCQSVECANAMKELTWAHSVLKGY